jgi:CheY-like chemotaxis protein
MHKDATKDKTILVCEDNEIVRLEVARVLSESGFNVLQAEDGETALELCMFAHVDLVLLDIVLPKMTGLECYNEIKKLKHSITVVLTSFASPPKSFNINNPEAKFIEKSHDLKQLPKQLMDILSHPGLISLVCSAIALNEEFLHWR